MRRYDTCKSMYSGTYPVHEIKYVC